MKKTLCLLLLLTVFVGLFGCGADAPNIPDWELSSLETKRIADGVDYSQLAYHDSEGLPYILYVLTVDPQQADLYTGTVNDSYNLMAPNGQTVTEQMKKAVENGIHAVAGINGDFFNKKETLTSTGYCVKEGRVIRDNTKYRPYSAFAEDGKYVICDGQIDKIELSSLRTAVGGSHVIVKDGKSYDVAPDTEFGATPHPRTLSGVKADGTILLVVIDGRQPEISNGAPLLKCAQIMLALGAVDAINHDGGGSSTMVLHTDDTYETVNSPSDGNLRPVYNSILVVPKNTPKEENQ